jgi:hypothetical protein
LSLDGQRHVAKLTLGALAELEAALETGSLMDLVRAVRGAAFSTRDVLALIVAGLRGGGWQGTAADLLRSRSAAGRWRRRGRRRSCWRGPSRCRAKDECGSTGRADAGGPGGLGLEPAVFWR